MEELPEILKAYSFGGISSLETNAKEYLQMDNKSRKYFIIFI
jgi:hypothetical protein